MKVLDKIDYKLISLLSPEQAHAFRAIPISEEHGHLLIAGDPSTQNRELMLGLILGKQIKVELYKDEVLEKYLMQYYPSDQRSSIQRKQMVHQEDESNIIGFVNLVLEEAAQMKASDVHFERYESEARIRFRWEGQLIEKYEIPLPQYNAVVSRLKIMADLDISERRLPQDGRINLQSNSQQIDVRVSSIPTKHGEKVVLRLLTRSHEHLVVDNLGMGAWEKAAYDRAIQNPNGIILITGPTGSGKTTTLYATLNLLNEPSKNILTVEDPVEYDLKGINQVQLHEGIGLGFDTILRAFLRQDPNIIMVGEIRDAETAKIAIRVALAGRLVFSTLHTNSSWDAIARLRDMGIEPYLLSSSIRAVVAQRLVRKLCEEIQGEPNTSDPVYQIGFRSKGCKNCYYTGYVGRMSVFEVLPMSQELKEMIQKSEVHIGDYLSRNRIPSLADNLKSLAMQGITSWEEAMKHIESE